MKTVTVWMEPCGTGIFKRLIEKKEKPAKVID